MTLARPYRTGFILVADFNRDPGVDASRLVQAVDRQRALERMSGRPRTIGQRGNADLVERVDVAPHARGLDLGSRRLVAEMDAMRAPHRIGEAIDIPCLEA